MVKSRLSMMRVTGTQHRPSRPPSRSPVFCQEHVFGENVHALDAFLAESGGEGVVAMEVLFEGATEKGFVAVRRESTTGIGTHRPRRLERIVTVSLDVETSACAMYRGPHTHGSTDTYPNADSSGLSRMSTEEEQDSESKGIQYH